jgi:hypothetical protein
MSNGPRKAKKRAKKRRQEPFDGRTVRAQATFVDGDEILIGTHLLRGSSAAD